MCVFFLQIFSMFAFEHYGIVPDILTLAKGMGGGMPIGAFVSSKKIMSCLTNNPILGHISTFGGHPVGCAAALATINVIEEESLLSLSVTLPLGTRDDLCLLLSMMGP